ncbi:MULTISPECIES: CD3324 family protein [Bacillaceae]|uniref:CD3324 family protein n=1 Tax=Bacillaceae TaxID=186817 RepID=UPI00200601F2|nr:CD3324 family protein [Bacillus infantis]MCK6206336.1 hypothetical protein [Bacillus infantis]MDW2876811.1 CD3324 family protein [Bacillus infantis]
MGYVKATQVLPSELLLAIQEYVEGDYLYIPRKKGNEKSWGEKSGTKYTLRIRNREIYQKYKEGKSKQDLATEYFLSIKSIERIISKEYTH